MRKKHALLTDRIKLVIIANEIYFRRIASIYFPLRVRPLNHAAEFGIIINRITAVTFIAIRRLPTTHKLERRERKTQADCFSMGKHS